jgi:hypothetical protein
MDLLGSSGNESTPGRARATANRAVAKRPARRASAALLTMRAFPDPLSNVLPPSGRFLRTTIAAVATVLLTTSGLLVWALLADPQVVPRGVPVAAGAVALVGMLIAPFLVRNWRARPGASRENEQLDNLLGADDAGRRPLRGKGHKRSKSFPVTLQDDYKARQHLCIDGVGVRSIGKDSADVTQKSDATALVEAPPLADVGLARSVDRRRHPRMERKSVLMGVLASGFVITNAARPSAAVAASPPTYVPTWTPATAYELGQQVISPNNDVVSANAAHTSSAAYAVDTAKWDLSTTFNATYAQRAEMSDRIRYVTDPTLAVGGTLTNLTTPTYDGSGVAVHPSIAFEPDGWNGHRYWMVMTPYTNANNRLENPSLLVSDDGSTWEVPSGVTNPLVPAPATGCYNSDPNLVFGPDGRLYLFYRFYNSVTAPQYEENIMLLSSADGVNWTTPQIIISNDQSVRRPVAPTVVYERSTRQWVMYAMDVLPSPRLLIRMTAVTPAGSWSAPVGCTITGNAGVPWHTDVHKVGGQWQMLVMDGGSGGGDLWTAVSQDGINWTAGQSIIARGPIPFDRYYKSCFVPVIKDGLAGWDMWVGGANFGTAGPQIARTFVSFTRTVISEQVRGQQNTMDVLSARAGLPPWIAADSFARTDSSGLGKGDTGQAWTVSSGTFNISGKTAVAPVYANNRVYIETGVVDHWAQVQLVNAFNTDQAWVIARLVDGSNYYRLGVTGSGPDMELQKVVSGSVTALATYSGLVGLSNLGDTISLRCKGPTLQAYRNGVALGAAVTDSSLSGTKVGFQAAATDVNFRNFTVRTP